MDFGKIEKISKKMEWGHQRFFTAGTIAVLVLVGSTVPIIDWYSFFIIAGLGVYFCYTLLFTQFSFPIKFGGEGRGIKLGPFSK